MPRISIAVTAAALSALTALTACGPIQMGSAAVLGGQTISSATLTREVANWSSAYKASGGRIQLQFPKARAPQVVLAWMVRFQIRERMAVRNNIAITPANSRQAIDRLTQQFKANGATLQEVAVANGLPLDLLPELGRYQAIETALVNRMDGGKLPTSSSDLQALGARFNHSECVAAKSLSIKVNPQYGSMEYAQYSVVPATLTLSAPQGGIPPASSSLPTAPAC